MNATRLLAPLALAATLVATAPSDASAASGRFLMYVKGTQTTTWDEPEHLVRVDCNSHDFRSANGKEAMTFRSVRPQVVTLLANGGAALVSYGKPGPNQPTGISALGSLTRSATIEDRKAASTCTRDLQQPPKPAFDCGTRQLSKDAMVSWIKPGRVELSLTDSLIEPLGPKGFSTCPLELPVPEMGRVTPEQGGDLTKVEAKASAAQLLRVEPGKTKVITGSDSFSSTTSGPFDARITATQTVRWQIRLLRLKSR